MSEAQQFGGSGLRDGMPGLHSGCANAGRACRHRWLVAWYGPRRGPSTESNHQGAGVAPLVIKYGCAGRETNVVCMDEAASPHQRDDRVPAPTDAARDGAPVHIMSGPPRLGQIEPRERAGAQTGRKYEYQYERTARAALDLLTDAAKHVCVYCDWHDDYVVETGDPPTRYVFHQVKGRKSSQGPWTFSEFFGVVMNKAKKPSKRTATMKADAVAPRMMQHYRKFSDNCAGVAFVTNAGLDPALSEFLEAIGASADISALPGRADCFRSSRRAPMPRPIRRWRHRPTRCSHGSGSERA